MDLVNNLSLCLFFVFCFFLNFLNYSFFLLCKKKKKKGINLITTISFGSIIIIILNARIIKNWTIPIITCKFSIKFEAIFYGGELFIKINKYIKSEKIFTKQTCLSFFFKKERERMAYKEKKVIWVSWVGMGPFSWLLSRYLFNEFNI